MSEAAKDARRKMQEKAKRLTTASNEKVDASDFDGYPDLEANVATGARPLSRRQFRKGGKVVAKVEGVDAKHHMGRKPRKGGGSALTPDGLINRDVREANEKRDGIKHDGGFKRGGATKHSDEAEDRALVKKMVRKESLTGKREGGALDGVLQGTRPTGGREARKGGGRIKKSFGGDILGSLVGSGMSGLIGKALLGGGNGGGGKSSGGDSDNDGAMKRGGRTARASGGRAKGKLPPQGAPASTVPPPMGMPRKKENGIMVPVRDKRASGGVAGYHVVDSTGSVLKRTKQRGTAEKALERISNRDSGSDTPGIRNMKHYVRPVPAEKYDMNTHEDLADQYHKGYFDRAARASGGRAKGKTNINIIIDAQPKPQGMQPPIGAAPIGPNGLAGPGAGGAMPIPVSAPEPMGGGAPPMPPQMPPQGAPMPRKSGGRAGYELEDGAGGGEGRLQKLRWYGRK